MRVAIVTDAWAPQVNGVVTTLRRTAAALQTLGHEVRVLSASGHFTIPCPTYPEIRLALWPRKRLAAELDSFAPDAIHVATEGPLGMAAVRYCTPRRLAFTTSYHTQFPQYVRKRVPIPEELTYALLRRHHSQARRTLVATEQQDRRRRAGCDRRARRGLEKSGACGARARSRRLPARGEHLDLGARECAVLRAPRACARRPRSRGAGRGQAVS